MDLQDFVKVNVLATSEGGRGLGLAKLCEPGRKAPPGEGIKVLYKRADTETVVNVIVLQPIMPHWWNKENRFYISPSTKNPAKDLALSPLYPYVLSYLTKYGVVQKLGNVERIFY